MEIETSGLSHSAPLDRVSQKWYDKGKEGKDAVGDFVPFDKLGRRQAELQ